jgi:hypothetical protein
MSTALQDLPNDAHSSATPAQAPQHGQQPQFGIETMAADALIGSLGGTMPLPSRDIPTAGAAMSTDVEVQPNHVTVSEDYITRLSAPGARSAPAEAPSLPPQAHDLYLLPVAAILATLLLTNGWVVAHLHRVLPKQFWHSDGTGTLAFQAARAAAVGVAVWVVNEYT